MKNNQRSKIEEIVERELITKRLRFLLIKLASLVFSLFPFEGIKVMKILFNFWMIMLNIHEKTCFAHACKVDVICLDKKPDK